MALLPIQIISRDAGLEIAFVPVDDGAGDTFPNDGQVFLVFNNSWGQDNEACICTPVQVDQLEVADRALIIPRKSFCVWGPFLTYVYNDQLGIMKIVYPTPVFSLTIAVVRREG